MLGCVSRQGGGGRGGVVVLWRSLTSDMQVDELQIPKLQAQVLITFNSNNNKMFNNVCFFFIGIVRV